jgi:hypothetical protein
MRNGWALLASLYRASENEGTRRIFCWQCYTGNHLIFSILCFDIVTAYVMLEAGVVPTRITSPHEILSRD